MMESNPSKNTSTTPEEATRLMYKNWREQFAMPLLIGTLILGVPLLIFSIQSAGNIIFKSIFIAAYIATGIVTVIRFSYAIRIGVFLFVVYALGVSELFRYGILGDASFFMLGLIVTATLLLSPQSRHGCNDCIHPDKYFGWLAYAKRNNRAACPLYRSSAPCRLGKRQRHDRHIRNNSHPGSSTPRKSFPGIPKPN